MMKDGNTSPWYQESQRCLFLSLLFSIVMEVLARTIRQGKEIRGIQIGKKKEIKLSLFTEDKIFYIENPKESSNTIRINTQV